MEEESNVFNSNEERLLNKSLEIREKIIDEYIKHGVSNDNRDNRVINEILSSMDSLIINKSNQRLKSDSNKSNEAIVQAIAETLMASKKEMIERPITTTPILDVNIDTTTIVKGEDKLEYEELDLEDFKDIINKD